MKLLLTLLCVPVPSGRAERRRPPSKTIFWPSSCVPARERGKPEESFEERLLEMKQWFENLHVQSTLAQAEVRDKLRAAIKAAQHSSAELRYLLMHPLAGLLSLTIALAIYVLAEAILEFALGFTLRPLPMAPIGCDHHFNPGRDDLEDVAVELGMDHRHTGGDQALLA